MGLIATLTVLAADDGYSGWEVFLSIVAAALFVIGVVQMLQRQWIFGLVLWIAAALIGPGGVSLLS